MSSEAARVSKQAKIGARPIEGKLKEWGEGTHLIDTE